MELRENRDVFCSCGNPDCKKGLSFESDETSEIMIMYNENGNYVGELRITKDIADIIIENMKLIKRNIKDKEQCQN